MTSQLVRREDIPAKKATTLLTRTGAGWVLVPVLAVAVAMILMAGLPSATAAPPPAPTYTVSFDELGLATSTSWSVTFNGVTTPGTGTVITFTGIAAGTYSWSVATPVSGGTGIQYVATPSSNSMNVNSQLTQWIVFQKQYQVTFAVSPSTSDGSISPGSGASEWYNAGSPFVVTSSPYAGYAFAGWKSSTGSLAISNKTIGSTTITVGASGTITGDFKQTTYSVTFTESGLPSGVTWTVDFNSIAHTAVAPKTIVVTKEPIGDYGWTAAAITYATGTVYSAAPNAGTASGDVYVPYQTAQTVVYQEQYQVVYAQSPSGDGSTTPSATTYYDAGANLAVSATPESGFVFSKWVSSPTTAIYIESSTAASTNVTVHGPGTLTADFKAGSASCTICTVTFDEVGLPSGTSWGVYWNYTYYGSTSSTLTITGQYPGDYYYEPSNPVGSGGFYMSYAPSSTYGYVYVPYLTVQVVVYSPQVWVQFANTPSGSGSTSPVGVNSGAWFPLGSSLAIAAEAGSVDWSFSKWTVNTTADALLKSTSESTVVTLDAAALLTAIFVQPVQVAHFVETGLPLGTVWGLEFNSIYYQSSGNWLNISGVPTGYWTWYQLTPVSGGANGNEYVPTDSSGSVNLPTSSYQGIAFYQQFYVTVTLTPSGAGSTTPYGSAWYPSGTILAISAVNGSGTFKSWASSTPSNTIASTSAASTTVTIMAPGTVTCTFT